MNPDDTNGNPDESFGGMVNRMMADLVKISIDNFIRRAERQIVTPVQRRWTPDVLDSVTENAVLIDSMGNWKAMSVPPCLHVVRIPKSDAADFARWRESVPMTPTPPSHYEFRFDPCESTDRVRVFRQLTY